jgi:hypothetical protein
VNVNLIKLQGHQKDMLSQIQNVENLTRKIILFLNKQNGIDKTKKAEVL